MADSEIGKFGEEVEECYIFKSVTKVWLIYDPFVTHLIIRPMYDPSTMVHYLMSHRLQCTLYKMWGNTKVLM